MGMEMEMVTEHLRPVLDLVHHRVMISSQSHPEVLVPDLRFRENLQ
tara:strand:- start:196 stop:333 length:138 start_codon:yes stop_codon:yes gene_type:complete